MADQVGLLTADEIAAMRLDVSELSAALRDGPMPWATDDDPMERWRDERIVATLEALQRERDEWKAAYQGVINGHS